MPLIFSKGDKKMNNAFCTNCGTQLSEGQKFCHICGTQRAPETPTPPPVQETPAAAPVTPPVAPVEPVVPAAPAAPEVPVAPVVPVEPEVPVAPQAPVEVPQAPVIPEVPVETPQAPVFPPVEEVTPVEPIVPVAPAEPTPEVLPTQPPVYVAPQTNTPDVLNNPVVPVAPAITPPPVSPDKPPKKKKNIWVKIIAIVLALAILAGGGFVAYKYFIKQDESKGTSADVKENGSDIDKILKALNKTIQSGSFDVEMAEDYKYRSSDIDGDDYESSSETEGAVIINLKKKTFTALLNSDNEYVEGSDDKEKYKSSALYYEGSYYYFDDDDFAFSEELDGTYEAFLDFYSEYGDISLNNIKWDLVYDLLDDLDIYEDFEDIFDTDEFEKAAEKVIKNCMPEFKVKKSTYTASVNVGELLTELADTLEDAFNSRSDYKEFKEIADYYEDIEVKLSITLSDGYVTKIYYEISNDENFQSNEYNFSNFGKAKISDTDIEDFIEECEALEEAYEEEYEDDYDDYDDYYDDDEDYVYGDYQNPDYSYAIYGDDEEFYDEETDFYYYYDGSVYYYYDKDLGDYFYYDEALGEWT